MIQDCNYSKGLHKWTNVEGVDGRENKGNETKREASQQNFYLKIDKGDLEGFLANFETFFFNQGLVRNQQGGREGGNRGGVTTF